MTGGSCRDLCIINKEKWKPQHTNQNSGPFARYRNAMLCRHCDIRVDIEYATGKGNNRCPCCNVLMRSKRFSSKNKLFEKLGYDPRDKTRIA